MGRKLDIPLCKHVHQKLFLLGSCGGERGKVNLLLSSFDVPGIECQRLAQGFVLKKKHFDFQPVLVSLFRALMYPEHVSYGIFFPLLFPRS